VGDTFTVNHSTSGAAVSSSAGSSPKTTPGQKRARVEKGDAIVLWILIFTSSYSDANFLDSGGPLLLLSEDEHGLSIISLVQAANWEVTRSFQVTTVALN